MMMQVQCLIEGSDKAEIVPQLTPQDGDVVLTHKRVGGFSASQLDVILRSRGVDTVVFAGVATNASVESTARQAGDLGLPAPSSSLTRAAPLTPAPTTPRSPRWACSPRSPAAPKSSTR